MWRRPVLRAAELRPSSDIGIIWNQIASEKLPPGRPNDTKFVKERRIYRQQVSDLRKKFIKEVSRNQRTEKVEKKQEKIVIEARRAVKSKQKKETVEQYQRFLEEQKVASAKMAELKRTRGEIMTAKTEERRLEKWKRYIDSVMKTSDSWVLHSDSALVDQIVKAMNAPKDFSTFDMPEWRRPAPEQLKRFHDQLPSFFLEYERRTGTVHPLKSQIEARWSGTFGPVDLLGPQKGDTTVLDASAKILTEKLESMEVDMGPEWDLEVEMPIEKVLSPKETTGLAGGRIRRRSQIVPVVEGALREGGKLNKKPGEDVDLDDLEVIMDEDKVEKPLQRRK